MARPIWKGAISFGLVTVPVGLYSATEDHTYHFHQLQRGTSDRIRYRRVNERTGEEVDFSDVVKGYHAGGDYVLVETRELEDVAPGRSRTLEVERFVDLGEIDPIFFQRTYWLAPADEKYEYAYALLCRAMAATNRVGVATFVMRSKQYLSLIRADSDVLALDTLYFADQIRDPASTLPDIPRSRRSKGKELAMATDLIESMSAPWRPEDYRDTYTERVTQLIEDKRTGRDVVPESQPRDATEVVDLTDALRRSMKASPKRADRSGNRGSGDGATDLSSLTKSELEDMARELGISGRSRMNRGQLQDAVERASRASKAS